MSALNQPGTPGCHPHSDQPNWRPADNADDYLLALKGGIRPAADELCPHCGGLLRVRRQVSAEHAKIVYDYLCELEAGQ